MTGCMVDTVATGATAAQECSRARNDETSEAPEPGRTLLPQRPYLSRNERSAVPALRPSDLAALTGRRDQGLAARRLSQRRTPQATFETPQRRMDLPGSMLSTY